MSRPRLNEQTINTLVRGIEALTLEMRTLRAAVETAPEKLHEVIAKLANPLIVQNVPEQINLPLALAASEPEPSEPEPSEPEPPANSDDEIIPPPRPTTSSGQKDGTANAVLWALAYLGIRDEEDMIRRLVARGYDRRKVRNAITAYLSSEMFALSKEKTLVISGPARYFAKERARIHGVDKAALARGLIL